MFSPLKACGRLWQLWPALLAIFLLLGVLFHTCSSCNSKIVWLSLSLGSFHEYPSSAASAPALIAPEFPQIKKPISISSSEELGRQENASVDQIENSTFIFSSEELGGHENVSDYQIEEGEGDEFFNTSSKNSTRVLGFPDLGELGNLTQVLTDLEESVNITQLAELGTPAQNADVQGGHETSETAQDFKWAQELEHDLFTAKQAISNAAAVAEATTASDLHAPLYHNISMFIKSYELMEKMFKIYVYKDGSRPLVHIGPTVGIYASEGRFIHQLQFSKRFVVQDPKKAHMFFLPYSVASMVTNLYVPDSHDMRPLTRFITNYVDSIASKYLFWNRSHGADHFFVSCHDWGPATARGHPELRRNGVKVVCNADLTEEFVVGKDVSLPETFMHAAKPPTRLGGLPPKKRPYLAFFAGHMHGRVRPILLQHWKEKDPDMKIYEAIPSSIAKKTSYIRHMKSSKFCICPMGYEVNSPRIVEAIYYDCVPVIIADNFVLPFSEVLDWRAFSLVMKEEEVPQLKQILLSIPATRYRSMQASLKHVRQHFLWHYKLPSKYDAFHMILHSVWLRRLASMAVNPS